MKNIFFFLISLISVFFMLNVQVPFFSDDIGWIGSIDYDSLTSCMDSIFSRQINVWLSENGRAMNHLVWQLCVANGELCYDIFISVVLLVYLWCVVNLAATSIGRMSFFVWSIVSFATLYLSPDSSSNFFWAAGGCHYLWSAMLTVAYLILLQRSQNINFSSFQIVCFSLFSFIAGWTHEIFALPISFALFCGLVYALIKRNWSDTLTRQLWLIVPYWIGAMLIVVSPGTLNRIAGNGGAEGMTFASALMAKLVTSFKIFRYGRCFYVLMALLVFMAVSRKQSLKQFAASNAFLLLSCLGSLGIVVILGVGGRAVWGVEVFSLLLIIKWLDETLAKSRYTRLLNKCGMILAVLIIVHQACLINPFRESWNSYRAMVEQTRQPGFEGTASMEEWRSDNPLIDPFVAHPYEMMKKDMWMRIPLHCNVCRKDIYDKLMAEGLAMAESVVQNINGEFVVPYSEDVENAINSGTFEIKLKPVTYQQQGSVIYLSWHQLIQKLWPERYPRTISSLYEGERSMLTIEGRRYLRFEQPVRPVYREIESVIINHHE